MPEFIAQHVPDISLDDFTAAYLACVEWLLPEPDSDTDYDPPACIGFSADAVTQAMKDCACFRLSALDDLDAYYGMGRTEAQAGHDFWLTRNHHGAGFWDRGLPKARSDRLTWMSQAYGTCEAYVGDDGLIYFA